MRPSSTRSLITVSTLLVSGGVVSFWRHHHSHHHFHHHHHHLLFHYNNHYLHHHQCSMTVMRTPSNAQSCVPKGIDTSPRVTSVGVGRWMGGGNIKGGKRWKVEFFTHPHHHLLLIYIMTTTNPHHSPPTNPCHHNHHHSPHHHHLTDLGRAATDSSRALLEPGEEGGGSKGFKQERSLQEVSLQEEPTRVGEWVCVCVCVCVCVWMGMFV